MLPVGLDLSWIGWWQKSTSSPALRPGAGRGPAYLDLVYPIHCLFSSLYWRRVIWCKTVLQCPRNILDFSVYKVFSCNQPIHTRFVLFTTKHRGWEHSRPACMRAQPYLGFCKGKDVDLCGVALNFTGAFSSIKIVQNFIDAICWVRGAILWSNFEWQIWNPGGRSSHLPFLLESN